MFESIPRDDASARLRSVAFVPLVSLILALLFFNIRPLFGRLPEPVYWLIEAALAIGTLVGVIGTGRVIRQERVRGRALGWLVLSAAVTLLCAQIFLSLTFPSL